MTGPQEKPTALDRIEALWAQEYGPEELDAEIVRDVLALVAVARAARNTGWRDADGLCWCDLSVELTGKQHRPLCLAMREALARLDRSAEGGAR